MNATPGAAAGRTTETSIEIQAPIEAVWKALNDAEEITRWFPLEAGVNPDGSLWMSWGGDFRFEGKADVVEPPHHIRTSAGPMVTEFLLETRGRNTHVRVVQSGFAPGAEWDAELEATHRGWMFQLGGLKHYLERHRGTPRRVAWARKMFSLTREQAWARLLSPAGIQFDGTPSALRASGPFSLRTSGGDRLEGTVSHFQPPLEFAGTVKNLNDAYLRISLDDLPLRGYRDVNLWLSTYGLPQAQVEGLQKRWAETLEELFA